LSFDNTSPLHNLTALKASAKKPLVLLTGKDICKKFCLGHISSRDSNKFCLGTCAKGYTSCGIAAHCAMQSGLSKFAPAEDHFWIPGLMSSGMPTALKSPSFCLDEVPAHRLLSFKTGRHTTKEWLCVFEDMANDIRGEDQGELDKFFGKEANESAESVNYGQHKPKYKGRNLNWRSDMESLSNSKSRIPHVNLCLRVNLKGMDIEVDFGWPGQAPMGKPSQCHRAALELLPTALQDSNLASKEQMQAPAREVSDLK
jgi:hypothetical protein